MLTCHRPNTFLFPTPARSDQDALGEAIKEALGMLDQARKPVVIADVELIRFKLQKAFAGLLDKTGFPYVTMMLGKTVLSEHHPQFIGLFEGDRSRDYVRKRVESADCVLQLGALMTDLNTGGFTTHLDDSKTISANIHSVKIKHHYYENVSLHDFILGLTEKLSHRESGNPGYSMCHPWLRTPAYGAVPASCDDTTYHQAFLRPCEPFYRKAIQSSLLKQAYPFSVPRRCSCRTERPS